MRPTPDLAMTEDHSARNGILSRHEHDAAAANVAAPTTSTGKNIRREAPQPTTPPPRSKFPTSLSDLHFNPTATDLHTDFYRTLRALHHSTLSPTPRLRSIHTDSLFVRRLQAHTGLPLVANERCGSWYIPPSLKCGSAYFKSTDGHHGQWTLSLRRLNLGFLDVLGRHGGAVLVDSTRRGKGMSDALKRTVPVWVGVVNAVLFGSATTGGLDVDAGRCSKTAVGGNGGKAKCTYKPKQGRWFQTPSGDEAVSASERSQIEARLGEWCAAFLSLGLDIEALRQRLKRPIKCIWAINGEWDFSRPFTYGSDSDPDSDSDSGSAQHTDSDSGANILVLASASRRVRGSSEMSEGGYVQGAADDSEGWSRGLTAEMWWANRERLLDAGEGEVEAIIDEIVRSHRLKSMVAEGDVTKIQRAPNLFIASGRRESPAAAWDLVVNCEGAGDDGDGDDDRKILNLRCREGKMGSKDLRDKLSLVSDQVRPLLQQEANCQILITCSSGRDLSIGVALALICLFYDDEGEISAITTPGDGGTTGNKVIIDKLTIKKRLVWITDSKADANPSRATMQAVNSFLIDRPPPRG